jgi:hypothetical protein
VPDKPDTTARKFVDGSPFHAPEQAAVAGAAEMEAVTGALRSSAERARARFVVSATCSHPEAPTPPVLALYNAFR